MVAQRGEDTESHTPDQMSASMALILLGQAGEQEGQGKAKRAKSEHHGPLNTHYFIHNAPSSSPPLSLGSGENAKSNAAEAGEEGAVPAPDSPSRQRRHTALLETLYDAAMEGTDAAWTDDGHAILFPNFEDGINRIVMRVRSRRQFKNDWATFTRNMRKVRGSEFAAEEAFFSCAPHSLAACAAPRPLTDRPLPAADGLRLHGPQEAVQRQAQVYPRPPRRPLPARRSRAPPVH